VALERFDAAVSRGPLTDLALAFDRIRGLVEHRRELDDALPLRAQLEEALLHLGAEVDAGGDLVGDRVGVQVELVELRLSRLDDAGVGGETLLDLVLARSVDLVRQLFYLGRPEGPALGEHEELKTVARLDDDVQASVGKAVEHLDHRAARAHLPHALVVLEEKTEVFSAVETLADQLAVARLEDVQRRLLSGNEDEVERKEPDLLHGSTG
jgi:hypothetical protein